MEQCLSFRKDFSALAQLQNARILDYHLINQGETQNPQYHIIVEESTDTGSKREDIELPYISNIAAVHMLTYLFENAVPFLHCHEIVANLCALPGAEVRSPYESEGDPVTYS